MEINESISIAQNPEMIWNFWQQVSNDVKWRGGIIKAEWTSEPPYGVGSEGIHYHKDFGALPWTITRWEDGHLAEFVHRDSRMEGSVACYRVVPENGNSRVSLQAKIVLPFFMRIMLVFMGGRMVKGVKDDLQKLKKLMETERI